ncbi:MAG: hypothetical protein QMB08_01470, partial [Acidimicrobiales bacterium]
LQHALEALLLQRRDLLADVVVPDPLDGALGVGEQALLPVDGGGEAAAATDPNDPLARIRSLVPAHLLERSAAARARLGG